MPELEGGGREEEDDVPELSGREEAEDMLELEGREEDGMPALEFGGAGSRARASPRPIQRTPLQRQVHGGTRALCALFSLLSPTPFGQQPSLHLPSLRPPWRPLQQRPFSHSPRAAQACAILHAAHRAVELFSPACHDALGRGGGKHLASPACTRLPPQALTQAFAPLAEQGGLLQATAQALPEALRELALAGRAGAAPHWEGWWGPWDGCSRAPWEYPLEAVEGALLPILAHAGLTGEVCGVAGACGSARGVLGLSPLFSASEPEASVWDAADEEEGVDDQLLWALLTQRERRVDRAEVRGLRGVPRLVWHALHSLPPYPQGCSPAAAPDAAGHALRALSRAHLLRGLMLPSRAMEPRAGGLMGRSSLLSAWEPQAYLRELGGGPSCSWLPPVLWAVAESRPEAVLALVRDLGFAGDEAGALTRPTRVGRRCLCPDCLVEDMRARGSAGGSASGGGCQAAPPPSCPGAQLTTPQALAQRLGRRECLQALAEASSPAPLPPPAPTSQELRAIDIALRRVIAVCEEREPEGLERTLSPAQLRRLLEEK